MEMVFFGLGMLAGIFLLKYIQSSKEASGVLLIDHKTELVEFKVSSADFIDDKVKKVIFTVDHNAVIEPRE